MKILWLTNIPSPYRVDFFNELGKDCELTVLFERANSAERNWQQERVVNFNSVIINGMSVGADKALCIWVGKWLKKDRYDVIVVSNAATPTGMLAIEIMNAKGIPFVIEGDGGIAKSGKGLRESMKRHFIKSAKYWLSTGKTHTQYYLTYGARKEDITVYPFTSLKETDILPAVLRRDDKKEWKESLGILEDMAILSVGQFIQRKGFDVLLNAVRYIPESCGVYIIGGEPTQEYMDLKQQYKLANVHFIGFKNKDKLTEYYKASDLFVLPTREDIWGLVINEAMARGLPIITTDRCVAGLELVNHENGRIIPADDINELISAMNDILSSKQMARCMSEKSLEKIRPYTIENMANVHREIFKNITERV